MYVKFALKIILIRLLSSKKCTFHQQHWIMTVLHNSVFWWNRKSSIKRLWLALSMSTFLKQMLEMTVDAKISISFKLCTWFGEWQMSLDLNSLSLLRCWSCILCEAMQPVFPIQNIVTIFAWNVIHYIYLIQGGGGENIELRSNCGSYFINTTRF